MLTHNDIFIWIRKYKNKTKENEKMKTRTEIKEAMKSHKRAIRKATAFQMIAYFIAAVVYSVVCVAINAYIGWFLMNWLFAFIIAAPILLREENIIKHHKRAINKLYDELDTLESISRSENVIRVNFKKISK